ncbi:MAG TPA: dihydroxy-acid dehydratase [Rubrobacteraceae bacterium]|nr:dihydroxy-acid dehydratase [Rubrobacteraceae bacterium]
MSGARQRIGIPFLEPSGHPDAIYEAGGEPVPLRLPPALPGEYVALAREWVADVAQISCAPANLDALLVAAGEPAELYGLVLAALRLNLPTVAAPPPDARLRAALAALGLAPLGPDFAETAVAVAHRGEPRPLDLIENFALANAVRAGCSLGGDPETFVHLAAVARESGAAGFSQMLRVLVPETAPVAEPGSAWFDEHGVEGVLVHLGDALHDIRTVAGRLREALPAEPPAAPAPPGQRLLFVEGRASGTAGLCRVPGPRREVSGECRVLYSERSAVRAVEGGAVKPGALLVVGGCGPRGGPGLPRLDLLSRALRAGGFEESVVVITDGLPPGDVRGTWVSLVSPEAVKGGVIGRLRDGDDLRFDLVEGRIRTSVEVDELESRQPHKFSASRGSGYAARYARTALPALEGAGFG